MQETQTADGEHAVTNSPLDPIRDLFRKIFQHNDRLRKYQANLNSSEPYMLLVQHSLRTDLRLQLFSQTSTSSDAQIYRHAGLLTPWETASKDLQAGELWMKHITQELLLSCPAQSTILLCATTPNSKSWIHEFKHGGRNSSHVLVLDSLVDDPWGWDSTDDESAKQNLNSLDNLLQLIMEKEKAESSSTLGGIVLESLTPLIQRHGMTRVQSFLSKLKRRSSEKDSSPATTPILVVPILTEMASSAQHRRLEDMSQSMLCLDGGQATWLRQGVRERGNLVRQTLEYDIIEANKDQPKRIQMVYSTEGAPSDETADSKDTKSKKTDTTDAATSAVQSMSVSDAAPASSQSSSTKHDHSHGHSRSSNAERKGRSKKMQLAYSDDGRQEAPTAPPEEPAPAPAPRIYMEENDPEFEDYDEEDPDDDLDI